MTHVHPNLLLDPGQWNSLADKLADPFFEKIHQNNERAVQVLITHGRDDFWTLPGDLRSAEPKRGNPWDWRILKHRLVRFSVSWRLTDRDDCRDEALRAVDHLTDPGHWTMIFESAGLRHADLKTADDWFCACFALEALEPVLREDQREGLYRLLTEWALPAYFRGWEDYDWWRHAEFNWGASVHGMAGMAALALREREPELSARALHKVREGLDYVIANLPEDGHWIEGLMYQTTTLGHLTDFIAAHHRLTGDDFGLGQNRRLHDSLDSRLWLVGGDDRPINFSNINEHSNEWRLPHGYWWAHHCKRPDWAGFEDAYPREWFDTHGVYLDVETFWLREIDQHSAPYQKPQGLRHAREIDWLNWKSDEMWFAFRSGDNGGNHTNRDLGQIVFGLGEERVLCDPGYGAGATHQHSCLTIRGDSQTTGARGRIFRVQSPTAADLGQELLYVCCDLSACFPASQHYYHRHVLASSEGWVLLIDETLAKFGLRAGAAGHLQFRLKPEGEGTDWALAGSPHGYRVKFLTPIARLEHKEWEWVGHPVHTLKYSPKHDYPFVRLAALLTPHDSAEARLVEDGTRARFEYRGVRAELDFAEGTCSLPL